jgi:hypothetical protein
VQEAIEMLSTTAAEKPINIQHTALDEPLQVYADPRRVLQILLNLIGNSIKYTPAGGWVEVKYGIAADNPGYAMVTVKDNGCGISETAQTRIFERLYQEESSIDQGRQGLGLGLAICKELVSSHTGKIWVESQPGHGSTFSFTLPIYSLAQIMSPALTEKGKARRSVSLITIRVAPKPTSSAIEQWGTTRRKCLEVLQRCTLPDKDVLLPPVGRLSTGEMFAILAGTDARGAEVLVRRIQEQIRRCPELSEHGIAHVSSEALKAIQDGENAASLDLEAISSAVSRAVSKALNNGEKANE